MDIMFDSVDINGVQRYCSFVVSLENLTYWILLPMNIY